LFDSDYNAERPLRTLLLFFRGDRRRLLLAVVAVADVILSRRDLA
jgi:hypothetical protein